MCGRRLGRRDLLRLGGMAAVVPLLGGCDEIVGMVPDWVPRWFVSDETVSRLGVESWQRIRQQVRPSGNAELQGVLERIGTRLLRATGADPRDWEMVVFASPDVNAFALPGNKIGVFEGMFRVAGSADQLAAVVGHEIGHLQAQHSAERLGAEVMKEWGLRLVSVALNIGDIAYANQIAALLGIGAEFGLVLPYSRFQELEADRLGLVTMAEAGFNAREAVTLWERMDRAAGGQRTPGFLSTHPVPDARIAAIKEMLPTLPQGGQG